MTEHLLEASCQSAAFHQIVTAMGKCHKKMKAGQKFTVIRQIMWFLILLVFVRFLFFVFFFAVFTNKKDTHPSFFLKKKHKKNPFFFPPYNSKTSEKSWKSQSSWHELFGDYFPRDHQLLVAGVMCWGKCTGGFRSITASRHNRYLLDRSFRCAEISPDQVPWCTGAVLGSETRLDCPWPCGSCPWFCKTGVEAVQGSEFQLLKRFTRTVRGADIVGQELSVVLQFRSFLELSLF